jgi:hypothetical protein
VFLRVLEFYSGVLFLTTNRVGVLDDAVKSRITWIVYYPPLDLNQTMKIWEVNLRLLKERNKHLKIERKAIMRFVEGQYKYSLENRTAWNGRQILNAIKVAASLSEWESYSDNAQQSMDTRVSQGETVRERPKLLARHFQSIAMGTHAFDRYLQETRGMDEAGRAFDALERADSFASDDNIPNFTISSDHETTLLSSPTFQPIAGRPRKHSATSATTAQPWGRETSPRPPPSPSGRRQSSQWQSQYSLPSTSRQNLFSDQSQPHLQRPRSSSQLNSRPTDLAQPPLRSSRSHSSVSGSRGTVIHQHHRQDSYHGDDDHDDEDEDSDWSEPSDPMDHVEDPDSGSSSSKSRESNKGSKERLPQ